nr:RNA-directed DNA polymerase, eukaryota [Tanacetum cinerariifolium]
EKICTDMLSSLQGLYQKAVTWDKVVDVVSIYLNFLVPHNNENVSDWEVAFEFAMDILLLLNYMVKLGGQTTPCISPPLEDFSSQFSQLQTDRSTNQRPWNHVYFKVDRALLRSGIFGVGVRSSDVHSMVVRYGCLASTLPFTYLGVKVGANMKRVNSWSEVVKKVTSKLSTWKAKTISVGGRLTLIKPVLGAIPTYYMSLFKAPEGVLKHLERIRNSFFLGADLDECKITWVSWRKVMAQKQHGGLGVNSLYALNLALIFKWIWRFKSAHSSLWLNVIKAIYGNEGSLDQFSSSHHGCSVWSGFLKAIDKLKTKGVDLHNFCKLVVGNDNTIKFWHDKWYGDACFNDKFHRCFNLELQKDISVALKLQSNDFALSFRRWPRSGIEES